MPKFNWLTTLKQKWFRGQRLRRQFGAKQFESSRQGTAQRLEKRTLLAAPHPLDLSTLNGTNGFRLDGIDMDDNSGRSVSSAGDVNGDGFDDLIIGASNADAGVTDTREGESYVVFGKSGGFAAAIDLSTLDGTTGFRLDGIDENDFSGLSVSDAGDVNGDGFDDVIIGARGADPGGDSFSGESYVVFGKSGGFASAIDLSTLDGTTGFRLDGIDARDYSGRVVSSAGDVNGDGFDDLIIGAYRANSDVGESYVAFGKSDGFVSAIDLSTLDGTTGFRLDGIDAGDHSGRSVSSAGDVNADGFDDLIIGASAAGSGSKGESYVVFGKSGGFAAAIDLSTLDGTTGFRLDGIDASDCSGCSVSSAGDVNGDGFDDLIIGASDADADGDSRAGESYVVFGKSGGFASAIDLSTLDGTTGFRLDGRGRSGYSVSSAGDVNGDGFDDVIIGARDAGPGGDLSAGESYVVFGKSGGFASAIDLSTLDGTTGFRLDGIDEYDRSGFSVSTAGDVNGDGFDDLIIGAYFADAGGDSRAGESYVVFGGNFTGGVETQVGTVGTNTLTANQGAGAIDVLIGGLSNDTLISDGGPDVLRGGEGDDTLAIPDADFSGTRRLVGGNGVDTLRLDGAGVVLDLTTIADNRIVDIEVIDIRGSGNNRLTLDFQEVVNISSTSNTLRVARDESDNVNIGTGWTFTENRSIDGIAYDIYVQGTATLQIAGPPIFELNRLDGSNGFQVDLGFNEVSGAGDINGDGFDDIILAKDDGPYVIFGRSAAFASQISVGSLDGTNGFRLSTGSTVSGAGDVNGDSIDDFIVGAPSINRNGAFGREGESYVVFGKSSGFNAILNLDSLTGGNGFRLNGDAEDRSAFSVSGAGDVNGDGFDDLIIGAPYADPNGIDRAGRAYVVFGKPSGFPPAIDLDLLDGTTGFRLDGVDFRDRSGTSVSGAGDVNGDGFDDLIIGTDGAAEGIPLRTGQTYVVFGKSAGFSETIDLDALDGTNGIRVDGENLNDYAGFSVSTAGDVNGDGLDDLLIGAFRAESGFEDQAGKGYVVFGSSSFASTAIDLGALDGSTGIRMDGFGERDYVGFSVSSAGDVNGDGFDDVVIGARRVNNSYIVFGSSNDTGTATQVDRHGSNTLRANGGSTAKDILIGGLSNDTLISDGGPDVLRGGEGDDTLAIPDADFSGTRRLVGGNGTDTLRVDGTGVALDLTTIADNRIVDIEAIDIRGSGANTLTLTFREVLNISSHSNTLLITHDDADDTVDIGGGWSPVGYEIINGRLFSVFTQGAATVKSSALFAFLFDAETGALTVPTFAGELTLTVDNATQEITVNGTATGLAAASVQSLLVLGSSDPDSINLEGISAASLPALTSPVRIDSGDGNDTIIGSGTADVVLAGPGDDLVFGLAGNDNISGEAGDDLLYGAAGRDILSGGEGDDRLLGQGSSGDILTGGPGTDVLDGGAGTDRIVEEFPSAGDIQFSDAQLNADGVQDAVNGIEQAVLTAGDGGVTIDTRSFSGSVKLNGGAGADVLRSGDGQDILMGFGGNDILEAGAGNDFLFGAAGRDILDGGPGNDLLKGQGSSGDRLTGGTGFDTVDGGSGSDRLVEHFPGAKNIRLSETHLHVDDETDELRSIETAEVRGGNDGVTIDARSFRGATLLYGGAGADRLFSGDGNDRLFGLAGDDSLDSGNGDDWLLGSAGRDTLRGGSGNDNLRGQGSSGDRLIGGPGIDGLDGGPGADIIIFTAGDNIVIDAQDVLVEDVSAVFAASDDWIDEV